MTHTPYGIKPQPLDDSAESIFQNWKCPSCGSLLKVTTIYAQLNAERAEDIKQHCCDVICACGFQAALTWKEVRHLNLASIAMT